MYFTLSFVIYERVVHTTILRNLNHQSDTPPSGYPHIELYHEHHTIDRIQSPHVLPQAR